MDPVVKGPSWRCAEPIRDGVGAPSGPGSSGGDRAVAGAHLDRAVPDPSRPVHSVGEAAQAQRLHPLGTQPGDGAVADGRGGGVRIIDGAEAKVGPRITFGRRERPGRVVDNFDEISAPSPRSSSA